MRASRRQERGQRARDNAELYGCIVRVGGLKLTTSFFRNSVNTCTVHSSKSVMILNYFEDSVLHVDRRRVEAQ